MYLNLNIFLIIIYLFYFCSNGTSNGGKQQAITSAVAVKLSQQQQQFVNGNSGAVELYSSKNGSGGLSTAGDGPLLPGVCDFCDGKKAFLLV